MNRLLRVELSRLLSRRLFQLLVVIGLVGVLAVDGLIAARSSNDIAAAKASADAQLQTQYQSCIAQVGKVKGQGPTKDDCDGMLPAGQLKSCLAIAADKSTNGPTEDDCRRNAGQNPYFNDPRFHFADHLKDMVTAAAYLLMAVGLVLAASFVGAEWQAGTFASMLTWEPRRQRVLAAKLLAPVAVWTMVSAFLTAVLVAGAALAASARGTLDGTTSHLVQQNLVMGLRVLGLIALVSLIGGAIAAFTRHTVAVVAVTAGYLIAGELVGGIVSVWWRQHGLAAQLVTFIQGRTSYYVDPPRGADPSTWNGERFLHAGPAAVIVSLVAAALVVIASTVLGRRDVT